MSPDPGRALLCSPEGQRETQALSGTGKSCIWMSEQEACRGREVKLHFEVQNVQSAVMVGGVACKKAMRGAGGFSQNQAWGLAKNLVFNCCLRQEENLDQSSPICKPQCPCLSLIWPLQAMDLGAPPTLPTPWASADITPGTATGSSPAEPTENSKVSAKPWSLPRPACCSRA